LSYAEGFEDAIELCAHEMEKTKNFLSVKRKIQTVLDSLKVKKFERLEKLMQSL